MPNNSKSPSQTQPSTLDIVLRNGQMNLATAIGRLEQAVTKAYGNINSSINSKQGEFNQALLKTLDQSISKSSDKMDQFYTSSFVKIYALNSAIMEQSLKKNGMAAAQKDLDGYRNFDKLIENQQRAFGDINASLKQIVEKIAPFTPEQKMIQTANAAQVNNADYIDMSIFEQFTSRHEVSKPEARRAFEDIQKNLFNVRNTENFDKDPFVDALTKNNPELLKKLKGTSDRSQFIVLLIESISKAYEENNQDILQKLPKYIKKPGIMATFTDKDIYNPTDEELNDINKLQRNVYFNTYNRAYSQKQSYDEMLRQKYLSNNYEGKSSKTTMDIVSLPEEYRTTIDQQNIENINQYNKNSKSVVQDNVNQTREEFIKKNRGSFANSVVKAVDGIPVVGSPVVSGWENLNQWRRGDVPVDENNIKMGWKPQQDKSTAEIVKEIELRIKDVPPSEFLPGLSQNERYKRLSGKNIYDIDTVLPSKQYPFFQKSNSGDKQTNNIETNQKGLLSSIHLLPNTDIVQKTLDIVKEMVGIQKNKGQLAPYQNYNKNLDINRNLLNKPNQSFQYLKFLITIPPNNSMVDSKTVQRSVVIKPNDKGSVQLDNLFIQKGIQGSN